LPFTVTWLCQQALWCIGNNFHKNECRVPHMYSVGNLVIIHQDTHGKLAKPTCGPYWLIDVAHQHVNGTIVVDLNNSHKMFIIWWLILFKPHQNHSGCNLLYQVPHHIIFSPFGNYDSHIWVITAHAEPLRKLIHFLHQFTSPFATLPSVLFYKEGLYISTQHRSKHWHAWLPVYQFTTSSLSQSRNNHIYFSSYSFHSTLNSTSLFDSLCHMANDEFELSLSSSLELPF
jgi:hypothetical protein